MSIFRNNSSQVDSSKEKREPWKVLSLNLLLKLLGDAFCPSLEVFHFFGLYDCEEGKEATLNFFHVHKGDTGFCDDRFDLFDSAISRICEHCHVLHFCTVQTAKETGKGRIDKFAGGDADKEDSFVAAIVCGRDLISLYLIFACKGVCEGCDLAFLGVVEDFHFHSHGGDFLSVFIWYYYYYIIK